MSIRPPDLFNFYAEKASGILRDRNMFLSIFLTTTFALFLPLMYTSNLIQFFLQNIFVALILLLLLTAIPLFVYMFCEVKYREYRWGYMKIAVKSICETELPNAPPETYKKLCKFIYDRTLFSPAHIIPILVELYPPEPSKLDKIHPPEISILNRIRNLKQPHRKIQKKD